MANIPAIPYSANLPPVPAEFKDNEAIQKFLVTLVQAIQNAYQAQAQVLNG